MSDDARPRSTDSAWFAERLRERVYVGFTVLAVLLALSAHADELAPQAAALTLAITVAGVLLAGFAADLVAHTVAHSAAPRGPELRQMVRTAGGAVLSAVTPLVLIGLSALGVMPLPLALNIAQFVILITFGVIALIALRHVQLPLWQRALLVAALMAVGLVAVLLELLAHLL